MEANHKMGSSWAEAWTLTNNRAKWKICVTALWTCEDFVLSSSNVRYVGISRVYNYFSHRHRHRYAECLDQEVN